MADEDERTAALKIFASDIITLRIGSELAESCTVHEAILKKHSEFFRIALNKQWEEGQKRTVDLPEDNSEIVAAYISWLYCGNLDLPAWNPKHGAGWSFLMGSYIFGEKVQDSKFCNEIVNALCVGMDESHGPESIRYHPSLTHVNQLFEGTPKGSPAREMLVHIYALRALSSWNIVTSAEPINSDFAKELLKSLLETRKTSYHLLFPKSSIWHKPL